MFQIIGNKGDRRDCWSVTLLKKNSARIILNRIKEIVEMCLQIKLLSENKLIICAFRNIHYQISREKFEPELEP